MRTARLGILRFILRDAAAPSNGGAHDLRPWCRRWSGAGLGLVLLCMAVYVPGLWNIPPVDRDEARFAQASRQMWESGDFIVPRIQDRPRLNKPPLVYWLQCASVAAFGDEPGRWPNGNIWVFRVPSALCALASVLLTWRIGLRMLDPRAAALGAALLAVCPMVAWDAHQARADQLLLLTVIGAQGALWSCWSDVRRGRRAATGAWVGLWVWFGLGILAKGPITPMIVILTIAALCWHSRSCRWIAGLRPAVGIPIVCAIVAPWVVAVGMQVGWSNYLHTVWDETIGRSAGAKEGHWGPPGYHLVLLCVLFWPGVMLTGLAVRRAWKLRRHGPELFLLAWIIPSWLVFEIVSTKLPHYTMPLYPAVALLSARAVLAADTRRLAGLREFGTRIGLFLWVVIGVGIMAAGIALLEILARRGIDVRSELAVLMLWYLFIGMAMFWSARSLWRGRFLRAQGHALLAAVLLLMLYMQTVIPAANQLSTRVVDEIERIDPAGLRPLGAVGYHEDSLIFLTRGRVERVGDGELSSWIESRSAGEEGAHPLVIRRVNPGDLDAQVYLAEIEGLNYSRGRFETVQIVDGVKP
ncbi:MAG: glycosyltransferase family 39 protein [Phycisphaeraceae bacterium]|nr:glycosyltransferase family 39 protein [Phycisphaeraceae bacterium]